jgi:hypothetical protein
MKRVWLGEGRPYHDRNSLVRCPDSQSLTSCALASSRVLDPSGGRETRYTRRALSDQPPVFFRAQHGNCRRMGAACRSFTRVALLPRRGLEPLRIAPPDPKSGASANFATSARRSPSLPQIGKMPTLGGCTGAARDRCGFFPGIARSGQTFAAGSPRPATLRRIPLGSCPPSWFPAPEIAYFGAGRR